MKILVTGGTGFIGSKLVERLKDKDDVKKILVLSTSRKGTDGDVNYIKGDISNSRTFKRIEDIDIVFHLASIIDESVSLEKMEEVNVGGTKNVLEFCKNKGVEQLIYTSTTGVYGKIKNPPADEQTGFNPRTNYEKTKLEAENNVREFMDKGLNTTIFRPTIVYGGNHYWKEILKKAKNRFPLIGEGNNHFHTLYVKNLIDAFGLALKNKDAHGKIYNIADEKILTYRETYEIMCEKLGVEFPEKQIPPWFAKAIAGFYEIKSVFTGGNPTITREYIDRLLRERHFDINKIKEDLNYEPQYNFKSGIEEVIEKLEM